MTPEVITDFRPIDFTKVLPVNFKVRTNLAFLLYQQGIKNPYAKILVQGTRLQDANLAEREQRLRTLACLHNQFPFLEIYDPLLMNDGWLHPYGMKLTKELTGNYTVVLKLDNHITFEKYTSDFYSSICKRKPVLFKAA